MNAFDRLDPLVQHHIVNSLGWRTLRPLQEDSIAPILEGKHCLLLAPTAGGKTEAAMFPLFSRMTTERWTGTGLLYVTPLRALLNNLHQRLSGYASLMGRQCEVWHGDVSNSRKKAIRKDFPEILLTTPESLEGMMVSTNPAAREMLRSVRAVVIDEIHALAGDDRGWHLLSLLERLVKLTGREIQRIGLSATVGNPESLLEWLASHCEGPREVIAPPAGPIKKAEVTLDYVGSFENAALVISRLHRGEKRLVFCDSRSRVEDLASLLRTHGTETYLSHSSLSAEERRCAEKAFAESKNCVIVSTSTLELGIDVGDLDRVVQIDAPNSVASFLQRIGRTGRRSDSSRNCLFLATSTRALLRTAALIQLWEEGFVEPVLAPKAPLHLFAQQLMALVLQEGGIERLNWKPWIGRLPPFRDLSAEQIQRIFDHLEQQQILFADGDILGFGPEGESLFGRRHFLELLAVFSTPNMLTVFTGPREIGQVECGSLMRGREAGPKRIILGGRYWSVQEIDWRQRRVHVIETEEKGRGAWIGSSQGLSFTMARGIQKVLTSSEPSLTWSSRTSTAMEQLRSDFVFLNPEGHTLATFAEARRTEWHTFAGAAVNEILATHLSAACGLPCQANELAITFNDRTDAHAILEKLNQLQTDVIVAGIAFDSDAVESLKYHQTLPPDLQQFVLLQRIVNLPALEHALQQKTTAVFA